MKKLLQLALLALAPLACHKVEQSKLDAAWFPSGDYTYFIYYDKPTFYIQKCATTPEMSKIMASAGTDVQKAKQNCHDSVTPVTLSAMSDAIRSQISVISQDELMGPKTNRQFYINASIDELERNVSGTENEVRSLYNGVPSTDSNKSSLNQILADVLMGNNLKAELAQLRSMLAAAKTDATNKKLADIDGQAALRIAGQITKDASNQAMAYTRLLMAQDVIYHLDANQNKSLITAIRSFDPVCERGVKSGESLTVDQGTERITYRCEVTGQLKVMDVTCPLPGYERSGDFCVFTGKGLSLASIAPAHAGICAVTKANVVTCWGKPGEFPMVGLGSVSSGFLGGAVGSSAPRAQVMGHAVIGADHSMCALDGDDKLTKCWPGLATAPLNSDAFSSLAGGFSHYCGVKADGSVKCFGQDEYQQIDSPAIEHASSLSVADQSSCAIGDNDQVYCWGRHMGENQQPSAAPPADLGPAVAVSAGPLHACAILKADHTVRCWGQNDNGQVSVPADLGAVRLILATRYESCAVTTGNDLRCWGKDASGRAYKTAPALHDVARLVTGVSASNTCAITSNGSVSCWGAQIYISPYSVDVPANVGAVDDVAISAVGYICAKQKAGGISCWGNTAEVPMDVPAVFSN